MKIKYKNPVWPHYFADPFVLHHDNTYYAYGTGSRSNIVNIFPILQSTDLVHWEERGGALIPLKDNLNGAYWAPEVAERDGLFYLYYSAADLTGDETHRLRVAVANTPLGPFKDSGACLLPDEGFTIDAHPFRDPIDGQWYLFFSRDYFDELPGTALACVALADDMISVTGEVITILRASDDWQIYENDRTLYNQHFKSWYTLEGAFVVHHDNQYYCFYSGGNYQNSSYGVGYAVASHILGPYREPEQGPVVLSGVEGRVVGPGHNSVVIGPDKQTQYIIYHAWDAALTARRLSIDPLVWTPVGPRCLGPTFTEQSMDIE